MKLLIILLTLTGCTMNQPYREVHVIPKLHVVYMDQDSIQARFHTRSNLSARLQTSTLQGYYDYTTNTLFCPKDRDDVCGHELKHAVLGDFH